MSIDWITVAAQIVNFLVLVWLLKRFLYSPILDGIDARERQITERMAEAGRIRAEAEAAQAEHRAEIARLKAGREGVLEEVRAEAEAERDALLAATRARLEREQAALEQARADEARRFAADLELRGVSALLALLRKALRDLSGETLEQRIVARAAERLRDMAGDLADAAGDSPEAVITTQAALPDDLQRDLTRRITQAMPGTSVVFRTDPDQSPGLNLRVGGAQLGWTADSYVNGLQRILADARHGGGRADAA
ncbi:F0F1 ATP synthase subunit B [Roseovarius sp. SCSIO 43702]|uniref:F0F1 ATP synthase subunit B family protein n=1 Tax=Roseovarius sp. SCSIO 43702 TaxID=2823043 RepID=UPI001C73B0FC|nr:F0F1 ATP synthase subunit B [Roseovarius sp. SCSIO 43702]QYX55965.1 F0F1 ATP synthase subunit B [Roseovarius sp. SCSIO 43702]